MIRVSITGASAAVTERETLSAGRTGLVCAFTFDAQWSGLAKTVYFEGAASAELPLGGDSVTIPAECLAEAGYRLRVGVKGMNGDNTVIPTVWASIGRILNSADEDASESATASKNPTISISVSGADATVTAKDTLTAGRVGLGVAFSFDSAWSGLSKIAVCEGAETRAVAMLDGSDTITIPWECMQTAGYKLRIGVRGESEDGSIVIPTVWASVGKIAEAPGEHEAEGEEPTPSAFAQVQIAAANALMLSREVKEAALNGDFDGTDGVSPVISVEDISGGHRVTFTDAGGTHSFDVMDGSDGVDGEDGTDGFSPTISITAITGGHTVSVTDKNGTQSFNVLDGEDGEDGTDGRDGSDGRDGVDGSDGVDGVSPAVSISAITGGHTVVITDKDHPSGQSFSVMDGEDGQDGQDGQDGRDGAPGQDGSDGKSAYASAQDGGYSGTEQQFNTDLAAVSNKLSSNGDGSNVTVTFTAASSRANISTGEKLSVIFGKIAKWFSDLGTAAFRAATATIESGSTALIESGAVFTALAGKLSTSTKYAASQSVAGPADKTVSIPMGAVDGTSTDTAFTATIPGITELRDGVLVWLKNGVVTSAAGCTLNINGLGAKPIYNSIAAATATTTTFNINYTMLFIYNSARVTGGCWDMVYGYDSNTTYTPVKLGFGYATCTTAAATAAKTASLSSYTLTANGLVAVKFSNNVPASATLNINSKGAKAIYYKDAAITAGVIKGGDTALFVYSTYYRLLAIDRWGTDITSILTALDNKQAKITASGILKGNGSSVSAATAGTDYIAPSEKGAANGVATLGNDSKVPGTQLPLWNGGTTPGGTPVAYQIAPTVVTETAPAAITLTDNTFYYMTDVSSLTLTYPSSGHWECFIVMTTASSGTVTVTLPASSYIGAAPSFGNGETWEISIRDGVVVAGEAEAAS